MTRRAQRSARSRRLESAGAECLVFACRRGGPRRGAKGHHRDEKAIRPHRWRHHAAGSPDLAGVIQRRTNEATNKILAPKIQGTLVLEELLAGEKLDFLVLCSTLGNVILGGKFGQGRLRRGQRVSRRLRRLQEIRRHALHRLDQLGQLERRRHGRRYFARPATRRKRARVLSSANSLNPAEGAEAFNRISAKASRRSQCRLADLESRARTLNSSTLYQQPAPAARKSPPPQSSVTRGPRSRAATSPRQATPSRCWPVSGRSFSASTWSASTTRFSSSAAILSCSCACRSKSVSFSIPISPRPRCFSFPRSARWRSGSATAPPKWRRNSQRRSKRARRKPP